MFKIKIFLNIKNSYSHIPYTLKHYVAFMKLQKSLLGYYKYKFHNIDKILMYLFLPFLGTEKIKTIHRKYNNHHISYTKYIPNYEEAIIDWECARFTKKDKLLTARETYELKFHDIDKHNYQLLRVLNRFNL